MSQQAPVYNSQEKVWSNPSIDQKIFDVPVGELLLNALEKHGDKLIQINHDTGEMMTCTEMRLKSLKIAENLEKIGIQRGDHVSIIASHRSDIIPVYVGVLAYGAVVNFVFLDSTVNELIHLFKIIQPKLIICDAKVISKVTKSLENLSIEPMIYAFSTAEDNVRSTDELFRNYDKEPANFRLPRIVDLKSTKALILSSSGTTGLPKCVLISHAMILCLLPTTSIADMGIRRYFAVVPHGAASSYEIPLCILFRLPRIITAQPLSADLVLEVLQKHDVNEVIMFPFNVAAMANRMLSDSYDLSNLKKIRSGGSELSEITRNNLTKSLPSVEITLTYGMTEIGTVSVSNVKSKIGSSGFLSSDVSAKIVDEIGNGLGPGETGEIYIKRGSPFLGYMNNEEATKNAVDADGYFRTGDIGYFDNDGELFIVDRKKDLIKYKAIQVAPIQLEEFIQKEFNVLDIAVVGVPAEDDLGQLPAAVIVLPSNSTITEADVTKAIQEHFSDVKHLRGGVYFVEKIPRSINGKIQRKQAEHIATELYKLRRANNKTD